MIEHAHQIGREDRELERAFVVVGLTVAARVPGGGAMSRGEEREPRVPVAAVAADAVEEEQAVFTLERQR